MEISCEYLEDGKLVVNRDFISLFQDHSLLESVSLWHIEDEPVKKILKERGTGRFFLRVGNGQDIEFYIKRYSPMSLSRKLKDLVSLKWRRFDAFNEWKALIEFHRHQLPTLIPVMAGRYGRNSFVITLGMKDYMRASDIFLEDSFDGARRKRLIASIAFYCAKMHLCGFAHQDLYLVHFFVKGRHDTPYLIDLQRVIFQKNLRRRWVVKDLGQLIFSCRLVMDESEIDYLIDEYCQVIGFDIRQDKRLFSAIDQKAKRIMRRHLKLTVI